MASILFVLSIKMACIVILVLVKSTNSEFFTAIAGLESLLDTEEVVIENLRNGIATEEKKLENLREILKYYEKEHAKAIEDKSNYVRNPVNSFKLIKRLTVDQRAITNIMRKEPEIVKPPNVTYPTNEDLAGAAEALGRLQTTYNLNITELANGVLNARFEINRILSTEHFTPMTASDCYQVGRRLYDIKKYKNAANWMLVGLQKYRAGHIGPIHIDEEHFLIILSYAYIGLDDPKNALEWTEKWSALAPNDYNKHMIERYKKRIASNDIESRDPPMPKYLKNYATLCRGELDLPTAITKSLKCRYLTENHAFLKLAPIKMEQLYPNPEVLLFHEVINDEEIQHIKEISTPNLKRAAVNSEENRLATVDYRITKIAWFSPKDSEVFTRVSQRTADFTGLSMELAEYMQVANYGIGGHYEPHIDFFDKQEVKKMAHGNRIATVLFYMSDVTQGGATAFTKLGLTVFPVKGAALFWPNLFPSGEGNPRTLHAACPVLRGEKWVMNRWILQAGQELTKPCPPGSLAEGISHREFPH